MGILRDITIHEQHFGTNLYHQSVLESRNCWFDRALDESSFVLNKKQKKRKTLKNATAITLGILLVEPFCVVRFSHWFG